MRQFIANLKLNNAAKNAGFTLIELMVVTTIVVLLLMTVTSMFMTYLVGNAQTNIRRQIKSEGNQMISQLEFLFRGAETVVNTNTGLPISCSGIAFSLGSTPITLTDIDNTEYALTYNSNVVYIQNGAGTPAALNTSYVVPSSPMITCYGSVTNQNKSIKIDFNLEWYNNGSFTESFTTTTQLRNS